nr:hypothetical protein [Tanacetum cinerariifolium]
MLILAPRLRSAFLMEVFTTTTEINGAPGSLNLGGRKLDKTVLTCSVRLIFLGKVAFNFLFWDVQPTIILGQPFLATIDARINCRAGAMDIACVDVIDEEVQKHAPRMLKDNPLDFYLTGENEEILDVAEIQDIQDCLVSPKNNLPVNVASDLSGSQEEALLKVLSKYKAVVRWTIADLKGISPSLCMHRIVTDPDVKQSRDAQKRLNPNMKEVVNKEVLKWLDAGIIYPISDSKWIVEKLSGQKFYCFWMGTSEIFMDDFSIFGQSFESCLGQLECVLKRCIETNLVLSWEKSHFMVRDGIVLGHVVFEKRFEADRAKVQIISTLPSPLTLKLCDLFLVMHGFTAFNMLKQNLVEALILHSPDWLKPFKIMCDTSDYAVGVVLGQRADKKPIVIFYPSNTFLEAQMNYTTTEKELLPVVFALDKFRSYIWGTLR